MKKNFLFGISLAFLLTGCVFKLPSKTSESKVDGSSVKSESSVASEKEPANSSSSSSSEQASSSINDEDNSSGNINPSSDVVGEDSSGTIESASQDIAEVKTYTYVFENANISGGSNLENTTPKTSFNAFMNNDTEAYQSFTSSNVYYQPYGTGEKTTLCVGTSSYGGEITFNFKQIIMKITFVIQAYNKYVAYSSSWNVDTDAQIDVMTEHYDLSTEDTSKEPEKISKEINLDGLTSITFSNNGDHQRVFIHSLTIEYNI